MRARRYRSDLTDVEWALLEPELPTPAWQSPKGGRPEKHPRREIVDPILYILDNGAKWRGATRGRTEEVEAPSMGKGGGMV